MNNFLSIIYLETNSITSEKISVGLLAVTPDEVFFKTSKSKIKIAEKLMGESVNSLVNFSFNTLEKNIQSANKDIKKAVTELFKADHNFNKDYVAYLNKYSQGLLQFDAPKPYLSAIDKQSFEKLFIKYIGKSKQEIPYSDFYNRIKSQIKKSEIKDRVDVDYNLTPQKIPTLVAQENISLITKNGNILAAQLIDFTSQIELVNSHIYKFESIVKALNEFGKEKIGSKHKGAYYVLYNQPEPKSAQEKFLNHLNDLEKNKSIAFKMEEAGYFDEIEEKIKRDDYQKFSVFEESLS